MILVNKTVEQQYDLFFPPVQSFQFQTLGKEVENILDYDVCPGCWENSFSESACQSCGYNMESPEFDLPESWNSKKQQKAPERQLYLREKFEYKWLEVYAISLDETKQNVEKIFVKISKQHTFIFTLHGYVFDMSGIDIDAKSISFQPWNTRKTKWKVYRWLPISAFYHQDIVQYGTPFEMKEKSFRLIEVFLLYYHTNH